LDKNAPADVLRPDRRTREVEAEGIAYTIGQHYGLDISDYSFGYVAIWSGDKQLDTLKSSLDTIRKEVDSIPLRSIFFVSSIVSLHCLLSL